MKRSRPPAFSLPPPHIETKAMDLLDKYISDYESEVHSQSSGSVGRSTLLSVSSSSSSSSSSFSPFSSSALGTPLSNTPWPQPTSTTSRARDGRATQRRSRRTRPHPFRSAKRRPRPEKEQQQQQQQQRQWYQNAKSAERAATRRRRRRGTKPSPNKRSNRQLQRHKETLAEVFDCDNEEPSLFEGDSLASPSPVREKDNENATPRQRKGLLTRAVAPEPYPSRLSAVKSVLSDLYAEQESVSMLFSPRPRRVDEGKVGVVEDEEDEDEDDEHDKEEAKVADEVGFPRVS